MRSCYFFPSFQLLYRVNGEPGNKLKSKRNTPRKGKLRTLIRNFVSQLLTFFYYVLFLGHWKVTRPSRRWASCSLSTATHPAKVSSKLVSSSIVLHYTNHITCSLISVLEPNHLVWAQLNPLLFVPASVLPGTETDKQLTLVVFDILRPSNQRKFARNKIIPAFTPQLNMELLVSWVHILKILLKLRTEMGVWWYRTSVGLTTGKWICWKWKKVTITPTHTASFACPIFRSWALENTSTAAIDVNCFIHYFIQLFLLLIII